MHFGAISVFLTRPRQEKTCNEQKSNICLNFLTNYTFRFGQKITRRTTTSERNKFLQVIASFRYKDSDIK